MSGIAIYSLKGGVGKTTLAVNLAAAAARSGRRTLLWDLDAQAASTWLLGGDEAPRDEAQAVIARDVPPQRLIRATAIERLDLLPADGSLRALDRFFHDLDKKKRLARLIETLAKDYDRVLLDCPPGLTETSEQILRAADLVVVPIVPAPLSRRAYETVAGHANKPGRLLPVFSMVDRRRLLHRDAMAAEPDWPVIPMASAVEAATLARAPLTKGPAVQAFAGLWTAVERRLAS